MARSVNYLNNSETIIFFTADWITEDFNYVNFRDNLISEIQKKLKSYIKTDKYCSDREVSILLENNLCNIGISEYCGAWSLSVAELVDNYYDYNREALAKNHATKIKNTLIKCLENAGAKVMNKVATFSNGEAVFEYKNKDLK